MTYPENKPIFEVDKMRLLPNHWITDNLWIISVDKTRHKSLTNGKCDARPTVTFPAVRHHLYQTVLLGDREQHQQPAQGCSLKVNPRPFESQVQHQATILYTVTQNNCTKIILVINSVKCELILVTFLMFWSEQEQVIYNCYDTTCQTFCYY